LADYGREKGFRFEKLEPGMGFEPTTHGDISCKSPSFSVHIILKSEGIDLQSLNIVFF